MDPLQRLWDSTEQLHSRFGTHTRVEAQMRVFFEEVYEFTSSISDTRIGPGIVSAEAVDVIVTVFSALQAAGIPFDRLADAIVSVAVKNDAKDWTTHEIRNGKISRRQHQPDRDSAALSK